jgi:hypothetical protein
MKYRLFLAVCCLLYISRLSGQTTILQVNANINLPKDSLESKVLISSLNNFLIAARGANDSNTLIWPAEKIETFIELDEISGIEKSGKYKDELFYKPYLQNVVSLNDSTYFIQLSYMGAINNTPMLRASFEFVAHKTGSIFLFSSMLRRNTTNWKTERIGDDIFHYKSALNKATTKRYAELSTAFDRKLKSGNKVCEFYLCDNITELQNMVGVTYKSDYNGQKSSVWASKLGNRKLVVLGNNNATFNHFDEHDLWHERLSMVVPRSQVNHAVDEGCAYLYGGSWGLTWKEIFKAFYEQVAANKSINWAAVKETPVYFKTKEFNNSADFIITALLIQKIEKEKGFAGVWQLLNTSKADYYKVLQELTGITKANYNERCWGLVEEERRKLKM